MTKSSNPEVEIRMHAKRWLRRYATREILLALIEETSGSTADPLDRKMVEALELEMRCREELDG